MGANDPVATYLIIEHSGEKYYSYRESKEHFAVAEESRRASGLKRLSETLLDEDCDLSHLPANTYIVINLDSQNACIASREEVLMKDFWGEKCEDFEGKCAGCIAWQIFESTGTVPLSDEVSDKVKMNKNNGKLATWDYRVVRSVCPTSGEESFAIYEVYYDKCGRPESRTADPVAAFGNNLKELKKDMKYMKKALKEPVLDDSIFNEEK